MPFLCDGRSHNGSLDGLDGFALKSSNGRKIRAIEHVNDGIRIFWAAALHFSSPAEVGMRIVAAQYLVERFLGIVFKYQLTHACVLISIWIAGDDLPLPQSQGEVRALVGLQGNFNAPIPSTLIYSTD